MAGSAFAQVGGEEDDPFTDAQISVDGEDHLLDFEVKEEDMRFGAEDQVLPCDGVSQASGLGDVTAEHSRAADWDQEVSIEEDNVLLGIALANNGASDIEFEDLRDFDQTVTREITESRTADLDREDVFSALALGVDADEGSLDTLACVSDREVTFTQEMARTQEVDLDEDTVLLAIALSNSIGTDLTLEDVASVSKSSAETTALDQTVDVDREDAFLALALGAGGDGGGGGGGAGGADGGGGGADTGGL